MKKLKFLILTLGLIAAQGMLAVTLPSTSYSEYGGVSSNDEYQIYTGTSITGRFYALGDGDGGVYGCKNYADKGSCSDCCDGKLNEDTATDEDYRKCADECRGQDIDPLPIEGGLWILLTLAIMSGILNIMLKMRKINVNY